MSEDVKPYGESLDDWENRREQIRKCLSRRHPVMSIHIHGLIGNAMICPICGHSYRSESIGWGEITDPFAQFLKSAE